MTAFEDKLRARPISRVGAPYDGQRTGGRTWICDLSPEERDALADAIEALRECSDDSVCLDRKAAAAGRVALARLDAA